MRFLNMEEMSELFRVSPGTVRNLARSGEIPSIRFGKRYLFEKTKVEAFIAGRQK